jgi:hypothetical protein
MRLHQKEKVRRRWPITLHQAQRKPPHQKGQYDNPIGPEPQKPQYNSPIGPKMDPVKKEQKLHKEMNLDDDDLSLVDSFMDSMGEDASERYGVLSTLKDAHLSGPGYSEWAADTIGSIGYLAKDKQAATRFADKMIQNYNYDPTITKRLREYEWFDEAVSKASPGGEIKRL